MKKILIFSHAMEIGGAERALLGLLDSFDYSQYSVDLFLMRHEGELFNQIPAEVNLLPELPQYASLATPIKRVIRRGQFGVAFGRAVGKFCASRYVKKHDISHDNGVGLEYSHKYTRVFMPKISAETYDLAISFLTPHYFVAEKVNAKKKIAWIHTDYSRVQVDIPSETAMWDAYDRIVSISDAVTDSFLATFPLLKNKIVLIENILPKKLIRHQADAFAVDIEMPCDGIRLLSVGRYCTAKNFDNVPDICARLVREGLDVYWYIIGFGPDETLIRQKIKEAGMEKRVILLGKKENPYPYIAACDLYVQPSRYEGKCVTVREAQLLGKPVVITRYATSVSQLEEGVDGIIVPTDNDGCASGIALLLKNRAQMDRISTACREKDFSGFENSRILETLI